VINWGKRGGQKDFIPYEVGGGIQLLSCTILMKKQAANGKKRLSWVLKGGENLNRAIQARGVKLRSWKR